VRLNVSAALTNRGDASSAPLTLVLIARQADSNIVADRATVRIAGIRPGRTATPGTTLAVPDDYNYYLDAVLWNDGVIVGTARSAAQLDPTERVPENTTTRESGFEAGDFVDSSGGDDDRAERAMETPEAGDDGPGFGLGTALVALLAGLLFIARRHDV